MKKNKIDFMKLFRFLMFFVLAILFIICGLKWNLINNNDFEQSISKSKKMIKQKQLPLVNQEVRVDSRELIANNIFSAPFLMKKKPALNKRVEVKKNDDAFLNKYTLIGIVLNEHPVALVESKQTKETIFLSMGDQLDQAVVEEITAEDVLFSLPDGQIVELLDLN